MNSRTRSFWACALVVALLVTIGFPNNLHAFWDKEHLKTAGIIAGISLGVGVAIILISGTIYDLKKSRKKVSSWLPDPDAMKRFAGDPSGDGAVYLEGTELTKRVAGPDIDLFTGRAPGEGRLLMPPLAMLRDPILLWPRFEYGLDTVASLPKPRGQ